MEIETEMLNKLREELRTLYDINFQHVLFLCLYMRENKFIVIAKPSLLLHIHYKI